MTATKAQERKALEQIKKIVESLGNDSYIATAFEGCFEIAESNIENDFASSMKGLYINELKEKQKAQLELNEAIKRAEDAERIANCKMESADSWCARYHEANDMATKNWNSFREQEDRAEALELENMKLKAKLYDMMVGA